MLIAKFIEEGQALAGSFFIHSLYSKYWLSGMAKQYKYLVLAEIPDYTPVKGCVKEKIHSWTHYGRTYKYEYCQVSAKFGEHSPNKAINIFNIITKAKAKGNDIEECTEIVYNGTLKVLKVIEIEYASYYDGYSIEEVLTWE